MELTKIVKMLDTRYGTLTQRQADRLKETVSLAYLTRREKVEQNHAYAGYEPRLYLGALRLLPSVD
ncbi:hypothetical protein [Bradyrhizobium iriomotense]|uniref:Uncharacterized protein n=1 Tax=Bradyrhizobium iriomotense TaxID=441950 RepID=A0ABQ6BFG8_9BRAD|nr:hypothetical protein [Bradyrhizobium iriomotense]GLR91675.1 hypothetical protein GCM10007857_83930 [Bradyrhizobium iriomotense]